MKAPPIRVFDFFSGCGGSSRGFADAGMEVFFGLDIDADAGRTFRYNFPNARFFDGDIRCFDGQDENFSRNAGGGLRLFAGCAPCQPFSKQNGCRNSQDPRINLLGEFGRMVELYEPEYVFVENVPGMQKCEGNGPLPPFLHMLERLQYKTSTEIVCAADFGVPQKRDRLVIIANKKGSIKLNKQVLKNLSKPSTVRDWISDLPALAAGGVDADDADHQAASLSPLNLARIRATPEGGGRKAWPSDLELRCHRGHSGHSDVYGRLAWDRPAAGLTTRCISYSNGRFGHPEQDRAISVREAGCLQTFPRSYRFFGSIASKARQIGNAVPPLMAQRIGEYFFSHAVEVYC